MSFQIRAFLWRILVIHIQKGFFFLKVPRKLGTLSTVLAPPRFIINVTLASRRLDGVRGHRVAHCPSGGALIPSPDP